MCAGYLACHLPPRFLSWCIYHACTTLHLVASLFSYSIIKLNSYGIPPIYHFCPLIVALLFILVLPPLDIYGTKPQKVEQEKNDTHLTTTYRYSIINNQILWNTYSWSFSSYSCCAALDDFFSSSWYLFALILFLTILNPEMWSGQKMTHTYQQITKPQ